MSQNAAEILKRAFSGFTAIAKRDPKAGVVEVDLAKVATELGRAAAEFGVVGDVASLEKVLDDVGAFIEKLEHDPIADLVFAIQSDVTKRFEVEKDADGNTPPYKAPPEQPGESYTVAPNGAGRAKKPTAAEAKQVQYTAGSGIADDADPKMQYTNSSPASLATTPGGKSATSFDQTAGGPNSTAKTAKRAKAQQPAHPETPGSPGFLLEENQTSEGDDLVSSGTAMRGGKKKVSKSTVTTTEELWARDMADMTTEDVKELRKAASKGAQEADDSDDDLEPRGEPDDRSAADAKRKKAKKAAAMPEASVDELEDDDREAAAAAAVKPNATEAQSGSVDEVTAGKKKAAKKDTAAAQDVDEVDEDEAPAPKKKTSKKGKPFAGAAKPFGAKDDEDDDESDEKPAKKASKPPAADEDAEEEDEEEDADEEDESDEKPTKKGDDEAWDRDMAPGREHMLRKSQRMTEGEVPLSARPGTLATGDRVAKIRKDALAGLSPDQVAYLQKSDKVSPSQKQRRRSKALKGAGYVQGSREHPEIEGVVESAE